jgi:hypothetical protein
MLQNPTPITPVEVKLEFKFLVDTQEALDYLTSKVTEESIISDVHDIFDGLELNCTEVNGTKVPAQV